MTDNKSMKDVGAATDAGALADGAKNDSPAKVGTAGLARCAAGLHPARAVRRGRVAARAAGLGLQRERALVHVTNRGGFAAPCPVPAPSTSAILRPLTALPSSPPRPAPPRMLCQRPPDNPDPDQARGQPSGLSLPSGQNPCTGMLRHRSRLHASARMRAPTACQRAKRNRCMHHMHGSCAFAKLCTDPGPRSPSVPRPQPAEPKGVHPVPAAQRLRLAMPQPAGGGPPVYAGWVGWLRRTRSPASAVCAGRSSSQLALLLGDSTPGMPSHAHRRLRPLLLTSFDWCATHVSSHSMPLPIV
jgi:hypothetical protein